MDSTVSALVLSSIYETQKGLRIILMGSDLGHIVLTGAAGFIGSNLVEKLLILNQKVVGLDNFETGYKHNLGQALEDADKALKTEKRQLNADNFTFIEGDFCDLETCRKAIEGVDYVLWLH